MKSIPIIFNGTMIRAIFNNYKDKTRRIIKPRKDRNIGCKLSAKDIAAEINAGCFINCPYGAPGDYLWVRETWAGQEGRPLGQGPLWYRATDGESRGKQLPLSWVERENRWRPSIHMPRWASRITLLIEDITAERIQEISDDDVFSEGIQQVVNEGMRGDGTVRGSFMTLWHSIHGTKSWERNDLVYVIQFYVIHENVDLMIKDGA